MTEVSDRKSAPDCHRVARRSGRARHRGPVQSQTRHDLGDYRRRRSSFCSCTCGSAGSPGPTSSGCLCGADRSADVHEGAFLTFNAILMCIGLPIAIWWFLVRPWRRERRITLDGMLLVSMGLMFFQDPLLNYFNTWCTYNTWLCNRGSWSSNIPGGCRPRNRVDQVARTAADQCPGLRRSDRTDHHDLRMLGDAQDQGALARTSATSG